MRVCRVLTAVFLFAAALPDAVALTNDEYTLLLLRFDGDLTGADGETPSESSGVTFEAGVQGQGAYFGPGNRLFYPSDGNIHSSEGTLEFWVKPRWAGDNHVDNLFFRFGFAGGMLFFKTGGDDLFAMLNRWGAEGHPEVVASYPVGDWPANQWRHVACTWNSNAVSLYVNGSLKTQVAPGFVLPVLTDEDIQIGAADFGESAEAVFDEFRISRVARSAEEILDSFLDGLVISNVTIEPDVNNLSAAPGEVEMLPTWWNKPVLKVVTDLGTMEFPATAATWSSSAASVAAVDAQGRIVSYAAGTATVTATLGAVSNSVLVRVTAPVLPPSEDTIDASLATPASNYLWEMPVVVIRYLPTTNGINLDATLTDYPATLDAMRSRIDLLDRRTKFMLEEGSRYHGYQDPTARPALGYRVVRLFTFYEPMPKGKQVPGSSDYFPAYDQILARVNAGLLATNECVREFWLWGWHANGIVPAESNMSSPLTGDISNSHRFNDDLPVFDRTYVLYNYNYTRGQNEAVHNHCHQLEAILSYACDRQDGNADLFWNQFCGRYPDGSFMPGRVGNAHYPPNGRWDYDYWNTNSVMSDCEDWTPAGTGQTKSVNCLMWLNIPYAWPAGTEIVNDDERTEAHYYIYWMQNMPGIGNPIAHGDNRMTAWWAFTADWDNSLKSEVGLYAATNTAPPSIEIRSFQTDAGGVEIHASHRPGMLYSLERTFSLNSTNWFEVYDDVTVDSETAEIRFRDDGPSWPSCFYRVKGVELINDGD